MKDDNRERIRITLNVIGKAVNACSCAVQYIEAEWSEEEYDLFIGSAATEAVLAFTEMLSLIKEKAVAADEALWECYRK